MSKICAFENIPLDGFVAGSNGEIDSAKQYDGVTEFSKEGSESTDTFLFGRETYDMMASFWHTPMGKSTNLVFAEALNNAPKIIVGANFSISYKFAYIK
jgi:dihydrofolate reductase